MLYTVFDLETTGLNRLNNDIVQFSYIRLNERFAPIKAGNLYFYRDDMDWSEEAYAIHKLSKDFLRQHKDSFEKNLCTMYSMLQFGHLVGHNAETFDIPFAQQYMSKFGLPDLTAYSTHDTIKLFHATMGARPKLSTLVSKLGIQDSVIQNMVNYFFKEDRPADFHDARYDVAATALCFLEAHKQGLI